MNWDEYKKAVRRVIFEISKANQSLERDIILGVIDEQGKAARREDIHNLLEKMFQLQDQLLSIEDSPETLIAIISDILELKKTSDSHETHHD